MWRLEPVVQHYAWGSHTAVAALRGRPAPTPEPEAELWFGAHPGNPSVLVENGEPLDRAVAADPAALLGVDVVDRYGPRLPFLLKVLAAAQPLSLQAHPDATQAAAGHAAETATTAAGADPTRARTYVDPWHKPELLVAVEEFDALCGFRAPAESAAVLSALGVTALEPVVRALRSTDPGDALRDGVSAILGLSAEVVTDGVAAAAGRSGYELVGDLADLYPGDPGVVLALLLNRVRLAPGEAVWMPAGNLHAYLRGLGVEVMAASDNVLRGGLTPKPVNVSELLRILRFEILPDPVRYPVPAGRDVLTWPVPVDDFALYRADVAAATSTRLPGDGPRVVLCLHGEVTVADGGGQLTLGPGAAVFVPAGAGRVLVSGAGQVYQATIGSAAST